MLGNKRYNGYYIYKDLEIKDGLPKIIDDELFHKVLSIKERKEINKRLLVGEPKFLII